MQFRNPHTNADPDSMLFPRHLRRCQYVSQVFGKANSTSGGRVQQCDNHLIAPIAAKEVRGSTPLSRFLTNHPQHFVARDVPVLIIDLFEMIDI
ncbi:hypothetical protein BV903_006055 [Lysobacter enzymogenes]|nr:hypothetical protein [Lysobacter enzymogenes]UZW61863.1 hypothetical protein BV903_006055 [Lysobacter enzymogenes]